MPGQRRRRPGGPVRALPLLPRILSLLAGH